MHDEEPTLEEVNEAAAWMDNHFQDLGKFAAAALVQARDPNYMGVAVLMARFHRSKLNV